MSELNFLEFRFLKTVDQIYGLENNKGVSLKELESDLWRYDLELYHMLHIKETVFDLSRAEIIDVSPDGTRFKLTDYGIRLFSSKVREEEEWINQGPFIKLSPEKKEEIDIKQGEHFKGYWEIVGILKRAKKTVRIQDAYIGMETIALLNELSESVEIQILTTDKKWKHRDLAMVVFEKFKKGRKGKTEIKINNGIHSRRLIIDDLEIYQCDESLKDIGVHTAAKIKRLSNIEEEKGNFDKAWKAGD